METRTSAMLIQSATRDDDYQTVRDLLSRLSLIHRHLRPVKTDA
jgi:hypothetical protein